MSTLIATKSCTRDWMKGYHQIIRKTWGKDIPKDVDLFFFMGNDSASWALSPNIDEIILNCLDDYMSLPHKTKAILEWSLEHRYEYTFLCDTDSFVIPSKLIRSGFERYDFSGRFGAMPAIGSTFHYRDTHGDYPDCHPWASGGVGYFLSRKAAGIIVKYEPNVWAEDMWIGQVLGPYIQRGEITATDLPIECESAWHFPRRQYDNKSYDPKYGWMEKMYNEYHN